MLKSQLFDNPAEGNTAMKNNNIISDDDNDNNNNNGSHVESCNSNRNNEREKKQFLDLLNEEMRIRSAVSKSPAAQGEGGVTNVIGATVINMFSAFLIFLLYLISLESLLSIILSASLTVYTYNIAKDDPTYDGQMSWTLLSFVVITPLSASIGMAFTRRDKALFYIANFRMTMIHLLYAHVIWDWSNKGSESGRTASNVNWLHYTDDVISCMIRICNKITRLLTLPNASRARHHVTQHGKKQKEDVASLSKKMHNSILEDMYLLTLKCECLKKEGMPANEGSRIRQWEKQLAESMEQMMLIKKYRTPQALRSFARVFTVFLPPFYSPYYGQLAANLDSLAFGMIMAFITSLALTSLFESMSQLEDPFLGSRLDCIDVESELCDNFFSKLLDVRDLHFPDADPFRIQPDFYPKRRGEPVIRLLQAS